MGKLEICWVGAFKLVIAIAVALPVLNIQGEENRRARSASTSEVQQLFSLATAPRPQRSRFVADIELTTAPATKAQVEAVLAGIEEEMQSELSRWSASQRANWRVVQSNAIVKARSGKRVLHVQEWYSGRYFRLDINDEGAGADRYMMAHPGEYRETFVDIPDSAFSQYASYQIDRDLRDFKLFKQKRPVEQNRLWQATQMDEFVAMMFVISLMDVSDAKQNLKPHAADFSKAKLDAEKARLLAAQTSPCWRLEAVDGRLEGRQATEFRLEGDLLSIGKVRAEVWTGQVSGKTVCLQQSVTNLTRHSATLSRLEKCNAEGAPEVWKVITVKEDSAIETRTITFKRIELNPSFTDEEAFAPVFPPDYIVSDMSSGTSVIIQNPHPEIPIAE
jgi:hypothetical protein